MREGSLEAPTRHTIDWTHPEFSDVAKLDVEMRRVADICHTCRRCFNLCDSFPRLFDLIDATPTGEVDAVASADFAPVVDACTLCDMCFMTKCPYVPPHPFNVDFPHLMLRYKATQRKLGRFSWITDQLTHIDRNYMWLHWVAPLINACTRLLSFRKILSQITGINARVALPRFFRRPATQDKSIRSLNKQAPGFGRKVALFATCYGNYHRPQIIRAAQAVLAHNGIETELVYPGCCGMPFLEQGNIERAIEAAQTIAPTLHSWIERGYTIVSVVPSCTFMMQKEWPLLLPDHPLLASISTNTYDISDYMVGLAKSVGLAPGLQPLTEGLTVQLSCHARAQNKGQKAVEMLKAIPQMAPHVIERCSGHGGTFGVMNFETALKVGRPTAKQALQQDNRLVLSECPLAAKHLVQGMETLAPDRRGQFQDAHPIEIMAQSYGLVYEDNH
jgi:glycerol-3-phosphate dehydrogenase subunit C